MRALFAFFAALFVFAAALQYNDPSPLRWMVLYLSAAAAAAFAVARWHGARPWSAVVGLVALIWGLTYVPAVLRHGRMGEMFDEWTMKNQEVVENREMFGLLFVVVIMALVAVQRPKTAPSGNPRS